MQTDRPVFARADTLLGICEAIGQDFRFDPTLLRVALGVSLLWNPLVSLAVYGGLGIAVAASRLRFPPRLVPAPEVTPVAELASGNDDQPQSTALAA